MPLILVPTPLGNLRDITLRALDTLREATLIVAEDTRTAQRLFHALQLSPAPLWAFHAHSPPASVAAIVERARAEIVAVLSDAGMPGVSDPGAELVRAARAEGVAIDVLPGPCAFIGAAVLSGFPIAGLRFCGFVPRTAGVRESAFKDALRSGATTAWYESPHRIRAAVAHLADLDPLAETFVVREYTKRFEQQIAGSPSEVLARLADPVRGEITMVFRAVSPEAGADDRMPRETRIAELLTQGLSPAAIAKQLARESYGERGELYHAVLAARDVSGNPHDEA